MADDFDDLFRSNNPHSAGAGPSTPGWGSYGEDDLTTANPFADLQSSRLYDSQVVTEAPSQQQPEYDESLSNDFAQKTSLSRRSTASSKASTSVERNNADAEPASTSASASASTSSASSVSGAANTATSSTAGDAHEAQDRVFVSPFITPEPSHDDRNPIAGSEITIGESEHSQGYNKDQTDGRHAESSQQPSYWSDQAHNDGFGNGFGGGFEEPASARPAFSASQMEPDLEGGGFEEGQQAGPSHSDRLAPAADAEDAASVRTVGLASDTASIKSHQTLIHPSPTPEAPRLQDEPSGKPAFIVSVSDPTKVGSAIDPINQHTVYTVRTRTSSSQFRKQDFSVLRRYRDFLWLVERLNENNPGVIVPPPPEKAAMGRFSLSFVESRRQALQRCLSQILKHPLLYTDPDLRLFLESDTFVTDVKQRALSSSASPASSILGQSVEQKTSSFFSSLTSSRFVEFDEYFNTKRASMDALETASKGLTKTLLECTKQRAQVAAASSELMNSFNALATCELSAPVKEALLRMAEMEKRKAEVGEMQTKDEEQVLLATAENYARLIGSARHAFSARIKAYQTWQKAETSVKTARATHEKAKKQQGRAPDMVTQALFEITEAERKASTSKRDFEDVSRLIKNEMTRFDKEKTADFKEAIEKYTERLAIRQREIVEAWRRFVDLLEKGLKGSNPEQGNKNGTTEGV